MLKATTGTNSAPSYIEPNCKIIVHLIKAGLLKPSAQSRKQPPPTQLQHETGLVGLVSEGDKCFNLVTSYKMVAQDKPSKSVTKALDKLYTLPAYKDRKDRPNPLAKLLPPWIV